MKVAYVTIQFPKPSETFLTREVNALEDYGIDVSVYNLRHPHPESSNLIKERGLDEIDIYDNSHTSNLGKILSLLKIPLISVLLIYWVAVYNRKDFSDLIKSIVLLPRSIQVINEIKCSNYDVVHLYWGHYPSMVGYAVDEYLDNRKVTMFMGAYDIKKKYGLTRPMLMRADKIFTLSKSSIKEIKRVFKIGENKIEKIYHSLDVESINKEIKGESKIRGRIITVGRLIEEKKVENVIRVFKKVSDKFENAELRIVGEGPDRERLRDISENMGVGGKVTFTGQVAEKKVFEEMAKSEVFLFMSEKRGERLPNVIKEAMLCKCLCVSSHTPGIEELIENGEDGFVVDRGDLEGAFSIIKSYLEEREKFEDVRSNAKNKIERKFNIKINSKKFIRAWREI